MKLRILRICAQTAITGRRRGACPGRCRARARAGVQEARCSQTRAAGFPQGPWATAHTYVILLEGLKCRAPKEARCRERRTTLAVNMPGQYLGRSSQSRASAIQTIGRPVHILSPTNSALTHMLSNVKSTSRVACRATDCNIGGQRPYNTQVYRRGDGGRRSAHQIVGCNV